ncbi:MAG: cupin domain-containing protein [Acidobacteriota bacterium]|nr:cupin domain-containing protein [Acidobacteriota bacterium]
MAKADTNLWPMGRFVAVVAGLSLSSALVAQDSVHFPPADAIAIRVMTDVPAAQLTTGFLGRTVVGATGSFSFAEFDDGAGAPLHHHEREQVNVGIQGVMEMALGTHTETLPVGAAVITPANVRHSIRNKSGGKLISLEFHTIRRPDLVPPRPRPAIPYPVAPQPVAIPDDRQLVVQLAPPGQPAGVAKEIQGETCTVAWRRLAPGAAAADLAPAKSTAELFVYVVTGEADLTATGVSQRIRAGTLLIIPGSHERVMLEAAGSADVALVGFRPGRH